MAITTLAGTKWELPNVFTCSQLGAKNVDVRFDFGSYLLNMSTIVFEESQVVFRYSQYENKPRVEGIPKDNYAWTIYSGSNITSPSVPPSNPPLVEIFGGEDATDSDVIAWFEANATQIIDPPATEPFLNKTGLAKMWQNIQTYLNKKQDTLVSGTNLKTVNGQSLLGSGNLDVGGGTVDTAMSDTSENAVQNKVIKSYVDGKAGFHVAVGQERWVGTYTDENNVTYQVYSKQVYIPALPATAGITTYEHGISNIKQILDIYGSTTDGFVLNAPRQTVTDNITIYQASRSASNKTFSIEVGKDRSNKKAYVTVIYAKNN